MKSKYSHLLSLVLTLVALLNVSQVMAQQKYFRYFEISLSDYSSSQIESAKEAFSVHGHMSVDRHCTQEKKLLLAVDASYPKRIDDVKMEIAQMMVQSTGRSSSQGVESISAERRKDICQ